MSERENILNRIRAALRTPAPHPGSHHNTHPAPVIPTPMHGVQEWLPRSGETPDEQLALFAERSAELKTSFHLLESEAKAHELLRELARTENWRRVASHQGSLTDAAVNALSVSALTVGRGYDVHELEACDVGITECDALIAQTGSVVVTSRDAGGRALSVLPPHHVVLARQEQLVRDLSAGFELVQRKYAAAYPSMISVITGPSRTGDIERILVLGAHGPKQLTVICIGSNQ